MILPANCTCVMMPPIGDVPGAVQYGRCPACRSRQSATSTTDGNAALMRLAALPAPKCRRCDKAEVYRDGLCRKCDDYYQQMLAAYMCVG